MRNSTECFCQLNPNLPSCAGATEVGGGADIGRLPDRPTDQRTIGSYPGTRGGYRNKADDDDEGVAPLLPPPINYDPNKMGEGKGIPNGGGGQFGSTGGVPGLNDKNNGNGPGFNTDIMHGTTGGGGSAASGGGDYGGGGGYRGGGRGPEGFKFNLKDYLPGGKKDPKRNMASLNMLQQGITPANGPSIWRKVQIRYQANRPTLMP